MIWSWVKLSLQILFLFVLFLIITFPFDRMGPKIARFVEQGLSRALSMPPPRCDISNFSLAFPFGVKMGRLTCTSDGEQPLLDAKSLRILPLPFNQRISAEMGKGTLNFSTNFSPFTLKASKVSMDLKEVELTVLTPLILNFVKASNPMMMSILPGLKIEGTLSGEVQAPFPPLHRANGKVDLRFKDLRLPQQPLLELLGLTEIKFDTSAAKMKLNLGKLEIEEFAFISASLSAKASGNFQFAENPDASNGNVEFKWQVVESDALRNSIAGSQLLNRECPNPDAQRFCTKRFSRPSDFANFFGGNSGM